MSYGLPDRVARFSFVAQIPAHESKYGKPGIVHETIPARVTGLIFKSLLMLADF
jgi:hypothetical protein